MAKPFRSKTLEKVARSIENDDEFVQHVFGIAGRYRAQYARETSTKGNAVRHSLKTFGKHATALETWLRSAQKSSNPEYEALGVLSASLHGAGATARAQALATQLWLASAVAVHERALDAAKRRPLRTASQQAAEALRATFEHHGLKVSYRASPEPSDAIRLLCALAKAAGESTLTPEAARQALRPAKD